MENIEADPELASSLASLEEECHKEERGVLSDECLAADEAKGDLKMVTLELTHNGVSIQICSLITS